MLRCYVLLSISDAWVRAYINVQHICTLIRRAVCAGGKVGFAGKSLHNISVFYLELYKHMKVKGHDI